MKGKCDVCGDWSDALVRAVDTEGEKLRVCECCADDALSEEP